MVLANTVTDANTSTKVSNSTETDKRPEATVKNRIVQETHLNKNRNLKIQIDTISDIAPDTKSWNKKILVFSKCNFLYIAAWWKKDPEWTASSKKKAQLKMVRIKIASYFNS